MLVTVLLWINWMLVRWLRAWRSRHRGAQGGMRRIEPAALGIKHNKKPE